MHVELYGFVWVFYFFAFKMHETLFALFSLPTVGRIGLDYFQAFMENFIDEWTFISADGWSLMGCPNFLSSLKRIRLWTCESVCWL